MNEHIKKQIKDVFEKTFMENIDKMFEDKKSIDVPYLVRLFTELRDRLCSLILKEKKSYTICYESFDVELFQQMLENDVFDEKSMKMLIDNTYDWITKLQSPSQDEYTKLSYEKVLSERSIKIISIFIMEANRCIDKVEQDLEKFYSMFENK
jgi:hypothetical protein